MTYESKGPIAAEIERRLLAALDPTHLAVTDDSEAHRGHAGHDPRGESHFTVEIVAPVFARMTRMERQRSVHKALGELLDERVHALAIRARAPEEEKAR